MRAGLFEAAAPEDRAALIDLWVEAWTAAMPGIDFAARRAWFSARLDTLEAEGSMTRLARDAEGGITGFVTVDPRGGYLDQLAIRPALRGSGLAASLIAEAKSLCPQGLGLHVNQDNVRAIGFYRREGFVTVSEGVNPRSGLPIWHMRWNPGRDTPPFRTDGYRSTIAMARSV